MPQRKKYAKKPRGPDARRNELTAMTHKGDAGSFLCTFHFVRIPKISKQVRSIWTNNADGRLTPDAPLGLTPDVPFSPPAELPAASAAGRCTLIS